MKNGLHVTSIYCFFPSLWSIPVYLARTHWHSGEPESGQVWVNPSKVDISTQILKSINTYSVCLNIQGPLHQIHTPAILHVGTKGSPAGKRHWNNVGWMLAHRLRRWPNIQPTLFQRLVPAGSFLPLQEVAGTTFQYRSEVICAPYFNICSY